jgi:metallo-beta-lactamase class B
MKKLVLILCIFSQIVAKAQINSVNEDLLKIIEIKPNIYQHISYLQTQTWGKVGCNGMIYVQNNKAIIFDTPTDDASAEVLYESLKKQKIKVVGVVVNHFHDDCLGGLKFFHKKGVKSYSSELTRTLAKKDSAEVPKIGFEKEQKIKLGKKTITNVHLGAAHTRDNIVSYLDDEKVMFGGCMVKELEAGKGFLGDADVTTWSNTIEKVKAKFPEVSIIIPGHGKYGGQALLDYTIQMFNADRK